MHINLRNLDLEEVNKAEISRDFLLPSYSSVWWFSNLVNNQDH